MKKRAFTLIELLIVIAIIAILATIIIVSLTSAAPKARKAAALASLDDAFKASQACAVEGGTMTARAVAAAPTGLICNNPGTGATVLGNWPTLDGYTYTITNTATAVLTVTMGGPNNTGPNAITCTANNGAVSCS